MPNKKEIILDTAAILFAEKGYTETSTAELAQLTKSAEGTIFYHFKTKNDIFIGILENVKEGIIKEFKDYIGDRSFPSGYEKLEKIVSFLLYLAAHREVWFRLLLRHYPYEFARMNDACRENLEAIYNILLNFFENAITEGQEDGSIREVSSRKSALIIFSMITGIIWLKYQGIYDTAMIYDELLESCSRILAPEKK